MSAAVERAVDGAASSGARVRLPLLSRLVGDIAGPQRPCWADLGPVRSALIGALSGHRAKLYVLDLPALGSRAVPWTAAASHDRAPRPGRRVHAFLGWDLLNYMSPGELSGISGFMASHAAASARMHALIQYSATAMPGVPGCYRLDDDLSLQPVSGLEPPVDAPRYSPKALEKAMPEWRVESTMLLNNGMQEFLLALRQG